MLDQITGQITNFVTEHVVLSGIGVGLILNLLQRIINDKLQIKYATKLTDWFTKIFDVLGFTLYGFGKAVSLGGTAKFGKVFWDKLETWMEHSLDLWVYTITDTLRKKYPKGIVVFLYDRFWEGGNYDNGDKK